MGTTTSKKTKSTAQIERGRPAKNARHVDSISSSVIEQSRSTIAPLPHIFDKSRRHHSRSRRCPPRCSSYQGAINCKTMSQNGYATDSDVRFSRIRPRDSFQNQDLASRSAGLQLHGEHVLLADWSPELGTRTISTPRLSSSGHPKTRMCAHTYKKIPMPETQGPTPQHLFRRTSSSFALDAQSHSQHDQSASIFGTFTLVPHPRSSQISSGLTAPTPNNAPGKSATTQNTAHSRLTFDAVTPPCTKGGVSDQTSMFATRTSNRVRALGDMPSAPVSVLEAARARGSTTHMHSVAGHSHALTSRASRHSARSNSNVSQLTLSRATGAMLAEKCRLEFFDEAQTRSRSPGICSSTLTFPLNDELRPPKHVRSRSDGTSFERNVQKEEARGCGDKISSTLDKSDVTNTPRSSRDMDARTRDARRRETSPNGFYENLAATTDGGSFDDRSDAAEPIKRRTSRRKFSYTKHSGAELSLGTLIDARNNVSHEVIGSRGVSRADDNLPRKFPGNPPSRRCSPQPTFEELRDRANETAGIPEVPPSPSLATQLGDGFASPAPSPSVKSLTRSYAAEVYDRLPSNEFRGDITPVARIDARPKSGSVLDFDDQLASDCEFDNKHENPQDFADDDASDSDLQPLDWDSVAEPAPAAPHREVQSLRNEMSPDPRDKFDRVPTPYSNRKTRAPERASYIPSPIQLPAGGGQLLLTPRRKSGGLTSQSVAFPVGSKQRRPGRVRDYQHMPFQPATKRGQHDYPQDNFLNFEESSNGDHLFDESHRYSPPHGRRQNSIHGKAVRPSRRTKSSLNVPPGAVSRNSRHRASISHMNRAERDDRAKARELSGFEVSPSKGIRSAEVFSRAPISPGGYTVASSPGVRRSKKQNQRPPKASQRYFVDSENQQVGIDHFGHSPELGLQSTGINECFPQEPTSLALPKARTGSHKTTQARRMHLRDGPPNFDTAFSRHSPVLGVQSASVYECLVNAPVSRVVRKPLNGIQNHAEASRREFLGRANQHFGDAFAGHSPKMGVSSVGAFNSQRQAFDNYTIASSPGVRRSRPENRQASRAFTRKFVGSTNQNEDYNVSAHSPEVGPFGVVPREHAAVSPSNNTVASSPGVRRSKTQHGRRRSRANQRKQSTSRPIGDDEFTVPQTRQERRRRHASNVARESAVTETPAGRCENESEYLNLFSTESSSRAPRIRPMTRRHKPAASTTCKLKRYHTMQPGMFRQYREQQQEQMKAAHGLANDSPKTPTSSRENQRPARRRPTNSYEADTETSPERGPTQPAVVLPEPLKLSFDLVEHERTEQGVGMSREQANAESKRQTFDNYVPVSAHGSSPVRAQRSSRRTSLRIYSTPGHSDLESPPLLAHERPLNLQPALIASSRSPVSILSPLVSSSESLPTQEDASAAHAFHSPTLVVEEKQRCGELLVPRRVSNTSSNGSSSRYLIRNPERAQDSPYRQMPPEQYRHTTIRPRPYNTHAGIGVVGGAQRVTRPDDYGDGVRQRLEMDTPGPRARCVANNSVESSPTSRDMRHMILQLKHEITQLHERQNQREAKLEKSLSVTQRQLTNRVLDYENMYREANALRERLDTIDATEIDGEGQVEQAAVIITPTRNNESRNEATKSSRTPGTVDLVMSDLLDASILSDSGYSTSGFPTLSRPIFVPPVLSTPKPLNRKSQIKARVSSSPTKFPHPDMSDIDSCFTLPVVTHGRRAVRCDLSQNLHGHSASESETKTHVFVPIEVLEALANRVSSAHDTVVKARARIGAMCEAASEFEIGSVSALESGDENTRDSHHSPFGSPSLTVNREPESDAQKNEIDEKAPVRDKDPDAMVESLIKSVERLENEVTNGCEDLEAEASLSHGGCVIM